MVKDITMIFEVYEFAKKAHGDQKRKTGEPYISHLEKVAQIATEYNADDSTICACLLHDTVEDTKRSLKDIKRNFGNTIAFLVDGVTKEANPDKTLKKIKQYSEIDKRVILIKLADRIHNTQTIIEEIREKYKRTNPYYIKLGKRFGYNNLASKLNSLTKKL